LLEREKSILKIVFTLTMIELQALYIYNDLESKSLVTNESSLSKSNKLNF